MLADRHPSRLARRAQTGRGASRSVTMLHDGRRAWKGFDRAVLGRLHAKGLIADPVGRAKSVVLTDEGLRQSEALFRTLFTRPD
ncbi:DUF6429 family protein [Methylobacterium sp. J-030]|uniref:DUF6429 family protein n=1 Tax=Methylobacterium sp. J-030 TaxID=2836627 RepID=UPI0028C37872|nr:DUF6429 family protein [Methylobacterium sp. J-030]